jgi:hypothetical protein
MLDNFRFRIVNSVDRSSESCESNNVQSAVVESFADIDGLVTASVQLLLDGCQELCALGPEDGR